MREDAVLFMVSLILAFLGAAPMSIAIGLFKDKHYFIGSWYLMITLMFATELVKLIWLKW